MESILYLNLPELSKHVHENETCVKIIDNDVSKSTVDNSNIQLNKQTDKVSNLLKDFKEWLDFKGWWEF